MTVYNNYTKLSIYQTALHSWFASATPKNYLGLVSFCFSWVSVVETNNMAKSILEEERLSLAYRVPVYCPGEPRQKHRAGAWSRSHGETMLIRLLSMSCLVAILTYLRPTCSGMAPPTLGYGPLTSKINWENATTDIPMTSILITWIPQMRSVFMCNSSL